MIADGRARWRWWWGDVHPATVEPLPAPVALLPAAIIPARVRALALPVTGLPGPLSVGPVPAAADPQEPAARLDLFGSATSGTFDPQVSDLDFLVTFSATVAMSRADQYFGLLEALERLFGRPVDLVTHNSRRNPYFIRASDASGVNIYAS